MRQRDRGRHQHVGLIGRVPEHEALVAGALLALVLAVNALGNVRRLLADDVDHAAARPVEAHVGGVVADIENRLSNERLNIHPGFRGDFAGDYDDASLDERLARHATARVFTQDAVQNGI